MRRSSPALQPRRPSLRPILPSSFSRRLGCHARSATASSWSNINGGFRHPLSLRDISPAFTHQSWLAGVNSKYPSRRAPVAAQMVFVQVSIFFVLVTWFCVCAASLNNQRHRPGAEPHDPLRLCPLSGMSGPAADGGHFLRLGPSPRRTALPSICRKAIRAGAGLLRRVVGMTVALFLPRRILPDPGRAIPRILSSWFAAAAQRVLADLDSGSRIGCFARSPPSLSVFLWVASTFPRFRYDKLMPGRKFSCGFSLVLVGLTAGRPLRRQGGCPQRGRRAGSQIGRNLYVVPRSQCPVCAHELISRSMADFRYLFQPRCRELSF